MGNLLPIFRNTKGILLKNFSIFFLLFSLDPSLTRRSTASPSLTRATRPASAGGGTSGMPKVWTRAAQGASRGPRAHHYSSHFQPAHRRQYERAGCRARARGSSTSATTRSLRTWRWHRT